MIAHRSGAFRRLHQRGVHSPLDPPAPACGLVDVHLRLPDALVAPLDDELRGALVDAGLETLGLLAPGRDRVRVALAGLAFAAAVRVIDRVHGEAADGGPPALPAIAAGLADADDFVLGVPELSDGGTALEQHLAHLGRGHADLRVLAFLGHQLAERSGAADELRATAALQLHVVDHGAERDRVQGQRVARADVDVVARLQDVADVHADRPEDVALLAVGVMEERDAGGAARVVLDGRHLRRHCVLFATPVDDADALLVAAAPVAGGDPAVDVASARGLGRLGELALGPGLRDLAEVGRGGEPAPRTRRLVALERHRLLPLEDGDGVALFEGDDRLLPVGAHTLRAADAAHLAAHDRGPYVHDLYLEEALDRLLHLGLAGLQGHFETVLVFPIAQPVELLGVDGPLHHVEAVHASAPSSAFAPACVRMSARWRRMS